MAVWAMFLYFKQQRSYQGTLGTLELTPMGSRASRGPTIDPTGPLLLLFIIQYYPLTFEDSGSRGSHGSFLLRF